MLSSGESPETKIAWN